MNRNNPAPTRRSPARLDRIIVVIPTFNERDNLEPIVERVRTATPTAHILVVDDNSPDGTGQIASRLAVADTRVHVLHRATKLAQGQRLPRFRSASSTELAVQAR